MLESQDYNPFEALSEIALTINTILDPDEVLERVLELAVGTLDAERGFVLLHRPADDELFEVRAQYNIAEDHIGEIMRISTSVVRGVLDSGEPILVFETENDHRFGTSESVVIEKIQSIACVPLRRKQQQIGAIYLDSVSRRGRFTPTHLPFLSAVANQAAVALENAELYQSLRDENRRLRSEVQRLHGFEGIIGNSAAIREVFETMTRVLDTHVTVMLTGESGTGKELVARAIHYNGERKDQPFVAVFCGSLPETLLESELFGHKKGSFTGATSDKKGLFEAASGGTIFLDEVSELSPRMQTSLLRVLQEGEIKRVGDEGVRKVDVRVLSATNRPLKELIAENEFREDLYYRLNTIEILLPPLRQRRSDIPLLANHFLDKYAVGSRQYVKGFTPDALNALRSYAWPGNVRELENTVERAVVLTRGESIDAKDLRLPSDAPKLPDDPGLSLKEMERRYVIQTMDAHGGNVTATAEALGVSRRWLHYRLKQWESPDE
ncbi:MAG: sigma-54-dependent Fis family transcriptional regulator [Rhodothermales bacterium]|nr:sigma-54-dependent Fis family transcriptional regulator [Rhodothermales bacterium]